MPAKQISVVASAFWDKNTQAQALMQQILAVTVNERIHVRLESKVDGQIIDVDGYNRYGAARPHIEALDGAVYALERFFIREFLNA